MGRPAPPADGAGLRWLFLDLNSYFASVEQQENPALRGRPVVVARMLTDSTCAIAASVEAKRLGIRTGTGIREARRLCRGVKIVPARHDVYVDYHHRIIAEIDCHIPITKVCSIDEVACELMGSERLVANAMALARRIQEGILVRVGQCLTSSVGLAPSRLLAKIASDMKKPMGLTVLAADQLPGRLLELKLTDLPGIAQNMERRLARAGITTVAAFWALSPRRARAVWGSIEGERFWYGLHGIDPPEVETQRRSIGHSQVLAPELRPPTEAYQVARHLLTKAATRLRRMDYKAGALDLWLYWTTKASAAVEARFAATADTFTLLRALHELWQQLTPPGETGLIKHVGVTLHHLTAAAVQPDLFDAVPDADAARMLQLSTTIDALNQRFGRDTVRIGTPPARMANYTGAKIAFTRIPDEQEFSD